MKSKTLISVVVNVRNEAENLAKCLRSIKDFADEIIVVDMKSTDNSVAIAKSAGAKVFSHKPLKYVEPARNYGLSKAIGKWILLLDPDEFLNKTLKKDLKAVIQRTDINFVKIPRQNIIFGKWIKHANCWPDYLIRFFKKGAVTWQNEIHSQPVTTGNGLTLLDSDKLAIKHNNYQSVAQFITRAVRYSNIQAEELNAQDYKLKISDFILKPIQEFNSRFFFAEGYKDGFHGLVFCLLQAFAIGLIYIRLWEIQGSQDKQILKESFVSASQEATFEYDHWFIKFFKQEYSPNIFKKILIKIRHWFNYLTKNF
ncbi:MAG: glycosyltransferase family 2 protein [Candidatus Shapirobacteria bacterium]|nr:glycosyltransferase family 2 protein [Candidatus Shapirobacteria bacterium]